ncbi:MAG: hypothetical protein AABZ47_07975 [Planctomycetota bacterium]
MSGEAKALAVLTDHPDWTDEQVAKAAGINRTTLYRYDRFKKARSFLEEGKPKPTTKRKGRVCKVLRDTSCDTECDTPDEETPQK